MEVVGPTGRLGVRALQAWCIALGKLLDRTGRLGKVELEEVREQGVQEKEEGEGGGGLQQPPPPALELSSSSIPDDAGAASLDSSASLSGGGQAQAR